MSSEDFIQNYLPLGEALYRIAFYALESQAEAEDAVQDLFLKLWNSCGTLDAVHNPKAYCITLMKNMCIDRIRKASIRKTEQLEYEIEDERGADTSLSGRETLSRVMKAVETLSERQKKILQMRAFEGLTYEEIAERTGISSLVLRVTLSNARQKIKKAL